MNNFALSPFKLVTSSTLALLLLFSPITASYASQSGCCSHHGGVAGCNTATNHDLCKDGTVSPTCLCSGDKSVKPAKAAKVTSKTTEISTHPTATTSVPLPVTTKIKLTGCCSRHGGVDKCNATKHYLKCKDGTISTQCRC